MTSDIIKRPALRLSSSGPERIALGKVRRDGGTQPRAGLADEHVEDLIEALERGDQLPPVVLYFDGSAYWLADGFHRVEAHQRKLIPTIEAEVRQGDRRAAVLHSVGANRSHGLPRSRADQQRAIETLLRDAEWGTWSDREIARQVGCSHVTVGGARSKLTSTGQIDQLETRMGADGKERALPKPAAPAAKPASPAAQTAPAPEPTYARIHSESALRHWEARAEAVRARLSFDSQQGSTSLRLSSGTLIVSQQAGAADLIERIMELEGEQAAAAPAPPPLPPLPPGFSWYPAPPPGYVRVWRKANMRLSNSYELPADAIAWAETESAQPITWNHVPGWSRDKRIALLEDSDDPMAPTALAALLADPEPRELQAPGEDDEPPEPAPPETATCCTTCEQQVVGGVRYSGLCPGCYHLAMYHHDDTAPVHRAFNLREAQAYTQHLPDSEFKDLRLAQIAQCRADMLPSPPAPAEEPSVEPTEPEPDRSAIFDAAKRYFAGWLASLDDRTLELLSAATWCARWLEATRQQRVEELLEQFVESIAAEHDPRSLMRIAALVDTK